MSSVDDIVQQIGQRFRTFGGGRDSNMNPLAHALKDKELIFAAGVDVRAVVDFVLAQALERPPDETFAVDPIDRTSVGRSTRGPLSALFSASWAPQEEPAP